MVGELRIEPTPGGGTGHRVFVDGQRIRARSISLDMNPYEIPTAEIEVLAHDLNIVGTYDIEFYLHPRSVQECAAGLRFSLLTDDGLRRAFLASIKSALDEAKNYTANDELAELVLKRLIGE